MSVAGLTGAWLVHVLADPPVARPGNALAAPDGGSTAAGTMVVRAVHAIAGDGAVVTAALAAAIAFVLGLFIGITIMAIFVASARRPPEPPLAR